MNGGANHSPTPSGVFVVKSDQTELVAGSYPDKINRHTHNREDEKMTNKEVAQKVVDRIAELIEQGASLPWVKPWKREPDSVKVVDGYKVVTIQPTAWSRSGKLYKGANTYLPAGEYITFKQCQAEGGKLRKGSRGYPVVYWNFTKKTELDPTTGEQVEKVIPFLKYYTVFHIEDCEGLEQKHHPKPQTIEMPIVHYEPKAGASELDDTAEVVIADYVSRAGNGFELRRSEPSDRAYYDTFADYVKVPMREQFPKLTEFYSTLFHELGHSTGHRTRLNRFTGKAACASFGSTEYSKEELVAEATAASVLNAIGMEEANTFRNSAAYIKSWSAKIKNDPLMYVTAATKAQAAFDLIMGINATDTEQDGGEA